MDFYLGIDLSSTNTGLALLDKNGELLFTYLIHPKDKNINIRYLQIKKELFDILNNHYEQNKTLIGIESPSFFSKGKIITLAAGWGYIYYLLLEYKYNVITYPPSQIKKYATEKGRAEKIDMYNALSEDIKLEVDSTPYKKKDDIVDAYWISKMLYKGIK